MISVEIPDTVKIFKLKESDLPPDWKFFPHAHSTQLFGDSFVSENKFLVCKVPSAVVEGEYNYLVNPRHPHINSIKVVSAIPFSFDQRLFTR